MQDKFKIIFNDNKVLALSQFRIPFDLYELKEERKKMILEFRNELIQGIKSLICSDNRILYGRYGSSDTENTFFDVENILFYNIGTGNFKELVKNGIAFSSFNNEEIESILREENFKYSCIYEYSIINPDSLSVDDEKSLAIWKDSLVCSFKGSKPLDYWKAIQDAKQDIIIYDNIDCNNNDVFGLDLTVYIPNGLSINIVTSMKPFLDGLICAFHGSYNMESDLEYLMEKLECDENTMRNSYLNILGNRQYVYKYRNNIKWNPADDLCKTVMIRLENSFDSNWRLSGRIYKI